MNSENSTSRDSSVSVLTEGTQSDLVSSRASAQLSNESIGYSVVICTQFDCTGTSLNTAVYNNSD
jgi:hypothetical protein